MAWQAPSRITLGSQPRAKGFVCRVSDSLFHPHPRLSDRGCSPLGLLIFRPVRPISEQDSDAMILGARPERAVQAERLRRRAHCVKREAIANGTMALGAFSPVPSIPLANADSGYRRNLTIAAYLVNPVPGIALLLQRARLDGSTPPADVTNGSRRARLIQNCRTASPVEFDDPTLQ